jgi:GNAT superfamily N-acetyltransferase
LKRRSLRLRTGRRHGFLENVVTHPDYRGRADPRVHRFYENCGFEPGVRMGYVAKRP